MQAEYGANAGRRGSAMRDLPVAGTKRWREARRAVLAAVEKDRAARLDVPGRRGRKDRRRQHRASVQHLLREGDAGEAEIAHGLGHHHAAGGGGAKAGTDKSALLAGIEGSLAKQASYGVYQQRYFKARGHYLLYFKNQYTKSEPLAVIRAPAPDELGEVMQAGVAEHAGRIRKSSPPSASMTSSSPWPSVPKECRRSSESGHSGLSSSVCSATSVTAPPS